MKFKFITRNLSFLVMRQITANHKNFPKNPLFSDFHKNFVYYDIKLVIVTINMMVLDHKRYDFKS